MRGHLPFSGTVIPMSWRTDTPTVDMLSSLGENSSTCPHARTLSATLVPFSMRVTCRGKNCVHVTKFFFACLCNYASWPGPNHCIFIRIWHFASIFFEAVFEAIKFPCRFHGCVRRLALSTHPDPDTSHRGQDSTEMTCLFGVVSLCLFMYGVCI